MYPQVYGLQVIVIYPTSTCCNKFWWNIYYSVLNLKIFFPKPSIFTTLCQITSCNLPQHCDTFLVDGMQRIKGQHPLEISLKFPTGSFSTFGQLDVFQVFHCGQNLGQPSAIFASWRWERWTCSFCSAMMSSCRDDAKCMDLVRQGGDAIKCILQEHSWFGSFGFLSVSIPRTCWCDEGWWWWPLGDRRRQAGRTGSKARLSITCHWTISLASGAYQVLTNSPVRGFTQLIYLPGQVESCLRLSLSKVTWEQAHKRSSVSDCNSESVTVTALQISRQF